MKRSARIVLIVVAACIVTGGTAFGVLIATTWGEYRYSNTYYYTPGAPSPIEELGVLCDVGKININYNSTPTDYYTKIELNIRIIGGFVEGKTFSDFFYPLQWLNGSSPITFDLDTKPTTWFIFGISYNITIDVTLRTDIIYDISAISSTGSIKMNTPDNSIVNNAILETSTGSISLNTAENTTFQGSLEMTTSTGSITMFAKKTDFSHGLKTSTSTSHLILNFTSCVIGGNLKGMSSTGSIVINSYNMIYTTNSIWDFDTSTGSIDVNIFQYIEMGANVTGSVMTSTASIDVYYKDNSANIGTKFTCSTSTGSIGYSSIGTGGFTETGVDPIIITSDDYNIASNKYTLSIATSTGSIGIQGESL
ncbi:MAG: hypothetical protein ACFE9Q_12145 [Candidatus Hodarchaeota archaeon]